jgi:ABC-2 type transport system permease protein
MSSINQKSGLESAPERPSTRLRHYFRIYATLWRNSVVREMGFKSNFILWIFVEVLWFALQLTFIAVIYEHTKSIGDWSKWEVVLLIGAAHLIQQIFQTFFLTNIVQISEFIRTGKLDFMLLLPANTRFLLSLRQVDLGGFVNGTFAIVVMAYTLRQLNHVPSAAELVGFFLLVLAGVLIHYSLMFLLATTSFWTVRAQGIVWGYYSFFNIARLPDAAFKGFFKAFFTFAIPVLLVANVPAKLLVDKIRSPTEMLLVVAMMFVCFVASELAWRFSLKRYTSASS